MQKKYNQSQQRNSRKKWVKFAKNVTLSKTYAGYIFTSSTKSKFPIRNDCGNAKLVNNNDEVVLKAGKSGFEIISRSKLGIERGVMQIFKTQQGWVGYGLSRQIADRVPVFIDDDYGIESGDFALIGFSTKFDKPSVLLEIMPREQDEFFKKYTQILFDLPNQEFDEEVVSQSEHMLAEHSSRASALQLTDHTRFITIDGEATQDFDDAIWVEKLAKGFEVAIAIADVGYYVKQGSAIDAEAMKRGNSYYRPTSVYPMLPEILSNNLCSLQEGIPKRCVILSAVLDNDGNVLSSKIERKIAQISDRLTYEKVDFLLNATSDELAAQQSNPDSRVMKLLRDATSLAEILDEKSIKDGEIQVLSDGIVNSARLIEKLMILANQLVAGMVFQKTKKSSNHDKMYYAFYRVMPEPLNNDWKNALDLFKKIDKTDEYDMLDENYSRESINKLFSSLSSSPLHLPMISLFLRYLGKAEYSSKMDPHFMLSLEKYTHFTSPIRRYIDLCVHRVLLDDASYTSKREVKEILENANAGSVKQRGLQRFDDSLFVLSELQNVLVQKGRPANCLFHVNEIRRKWTTTDTGKRQMSYELVGFVVTLLDSSIRVASLQQSNILQPSEDLGNMITNKDITRIYATMDCEFFGMRPSMSHFLREIPFNTLGDFDLSPTSVIIAELDASSVDVRKGTLSIRPSLPCVFSQYDREKNQWLVLKKNRSLKASL